MFFQKNLSDRDHTVTVTYRLLRSLNIPATRLHLKSLLHEHPDFPSLLSISDVLKGYGVENISLRTKLETLEKLSHPTLVQLALGKRRYFTVIDHLDKEQCTFFDPEKDKWLSGDKATFSSRWTGIVLVAEATEGASEPDYHLHHAQEKRQQLKIGLTFLLLPVLTALAILAAWLHTGPAAIAPSVFTLLTLAGVGISSLLLAYDLDQHNPALQQICSIGQKVNCSAVLHSKASKIFGISWSIIGFTYFLGSLLSLLITGIMVSSTLFLLAWLNIPATAYIFFSLFYQWRVVKQWCILCLGVQVLLAGQFCTVLFNHWQFPLPGGSLSIQTPVTILAPFLVTFIAVTAFSRSFKKAKEGAESRSELNRLKNNPQLFTALLEKQRSFTQSTQGLGISFGNPNAKYKIVKVCNPYCGPCAKAHPVIEELLHHHDDVHVQIIFLGSADPDSQKNKPIHHLLAIAAAKDEPSTRQAMDHWYNAPVKDYDAFAKKYILGEHRLMNQPEIEAMNDWCHQTEISFTPTFFINGYQLPEIYKIKDLDYLLTSG